MRDHNDHCLLTFAGLNWRIIGMRGLGCIIVTRWPDPSYGTVLDLSHVDWDAYHATALDMIAERDAETINP